GIFGALQHAGPGLFWFWYLVTIALVIAFTLGWRTRIITPLLFVFYTTLNGQNTPISDGGNYFIRIMLIYLILMDVSRRWSLDARRRARTGATETQTGSVLHNIGLCLVVAQICIVYLEAGLYKVQGSLWQSGTAVYYPLQSVAYGVFPPLADLLTYFAWPVFVATYVTVLAQIAVPFLLFHRITRRIGLLILLGMHLSIAVIMGLPFFSGIMASADAVLVSGTTWVAIVGWLRLVATENRFALRVRDRLAQRRGSAAADGGAADHEAPDGSLDDADAPSAEIGGDPSASMDADADEHARV